MMRTILKCLFEVFAEISWKFSVLFCADLSEYGDILSVNENGGKASTSATSNKGLTKELVIKWTVDTGKCIDASPVVVNFRYMYEIDNNQIGRAHV